MGGRDGPDGLTILDNISRGSQSHQSARSSPKRGLARRKLVLLTQHHAAQCSAMQGVKSSRDRKLQMHCPGYLSEIRVGVSGKLFVLCRVMASAVLVGPLTRLYRGTTGIARSSCRR